MNTPSLPTTKPLLLSLISGLAIACVLSGCPSKTTPPPNTTSQTASQATSNPTATTTKPQTSPPDATPTSMPTVKRTVQDAGPPAPTIFFLAGLKGYIEPCGCTLDVMAGGLDRVLGYVNKAKTFHKGTLFLDAGNLLFDTPKLETHRIPQERAKVDVILKAYEELGVASTTPGPNDFALGKHFYLDKIRNAGIDILAANLRESEDVPLGPPHSVHDLGDGTRVGVIGLVDPNLFLGIEGLKVTDPVEAAKASIKALKKDKINAFVAVYHGDLKASKELLEAVPELHFVVVGKDPRETDASEETPQGHILEAFDQGRYLGILKLYPRGAKAPESYINGRKGSKKELDRVDRRLENISMQIKMLPPATPGNEPPMLKRLREEEARLKKERTTLSASAVELPKDGAAFVYRAVVLEPGYPEDDTMATAIKSYKKSLDTLITPEPIPPVPDGHAEYVGAEQCAGCHSGAMEFWKKTSHGHAVETLVKRDSLNDNNCIGCHVTGYRKPGGSVLGKLEYPTNVGGKAFTKKLQDVGCEVCHGPGSLHITQPIGKDSKPQHIQRNVPESLCVQCHNSEHSSKFNYPVYIRQITGEGHPLTSKP